jgi:hypothetical protein
METLKYYPSNSSDGDGFMAKYCYKCYKEKQCTILTNALIGNQPKQWIYDENKNPICTSFNPTKPKTTPIHVQNTPKIF